MTEHTAIGQENEMTLSLVFNIVATTCKFVTPIFVQKYPTSFSVQGIAERDPSDDLDGKVPGVELPVGYGVTGWDRRDVTRRGTRWQDAALKLAVLTAVLFDENLDPV